MKYKKISSSAFSITVRDPTQDTHISVVVKKLHFDKKHNTMKVFFNATDCSELHLKEGEWIIEDYRTKASYKENLRRWRSGLQLTFNYTASQLLGLFEKRFIGLKINPEERKITIFKFPAKFEELFEQIMKSL